MDDMSNFPNGTCPRRSRPPYPDFLRIATQTPPIRLSQTATLVLVSEGGEHADTTVLPVAQPGRLVCYNRRGARLHDGGSICEGG